MWDNVNFLKGLFVYNNQQMEVWGNNRSVMPFDVLGYTRATMIESKSMIGENHWLDSSGATLGWSTGGFANFLNWKVEGNLDKLNHAGDRSLQLLVLNEEFLVSMSQQLMLITSLPFVHTARRSYRLDDPVKILDGG